MEPEEHRQWFLSTRICHNSDAAFVCAIRDVKNFSLEAAADAATLNLTTVALLCGSNAKS
jgi:hypothetical protein